MSKPSVIGKNHVLGVSEGIKRVLMGRSITRAPDTVKQTVQYILEQYPNIDSVISKYDNKMSDFQPDLLLNLNDSTEVNVNLFIIKGSATIQPKNLGAKSFLEKYFKAKAFQIDFNDYFDQVHKEFLQKIICKKEKPNLYDQIPQMKKKVNKHYPKFVDEIKQLRSEFLFSLREFCFKLLKDEYNLGAKGIQHAFNELMLLDSVNIITRYTEENKCLKVERWESSINSSQGIHIYKKGNAAVGIRSGLEALTLRFKFESSPTSSIKLATSYEKFPEEENIERENLLSIERFEQLIYQHRHLQRGNKSNSIGKCNEAMVYYGILKRNPKVNQVNEQDYQQMLSRYSMDISNKELMNIYNASEITTEKIEEYLSDKYFSYQIESIQLVGNSYLENRLDTSDLQLVLIVDQKYIEESFSLKAISKRSARITAKNPGIGQILGPKYFGIGSLVPLVEEARNLFSNNMLNHRQVEEMVSEELGECLKSAVQQDLRKGIMALLGKSTLVLTIYSQNESLVLAHKDITDQINVYSKTPTTIQTTLRWNGGLEELSLRVKFSARQSKGWSSLKLACEYKLS